MNELKNLRKSRNLLQKDIAKILGISVSTYCYWEKGDFQPDNEALKKIADYYGVTIDYLLGYEQQKNAPPPGETPLTDGEKALLDLFKRVPQEQQSLVLEMIKVALQTSK